MSEQPDVKPEGQTEHISIKVVGAGNDEVFFKIKRSTPLKKLMEAYCDRSGKTFNTVRFLVDGERVRPDQTPEDMEMEDGDQIECMIEQVGGC